MAPPPWPPSTCFSATRLTDSTFKIVHDDAYDENPFIYLKLIPDAPLALLLDTGCGAGGSRDKTVAMKSLREFIETYPQPALGGSALNPQAFRKYVVVCSHCHYDHICGIEEFADSALVASARGRQFVEADLPAHSLCKYLDIRTPEYNITQRAQHLQPLCAPDGAMIPGPILSLHTPGHTPDSLALYDPGERMLYVGDTLYEWAPTIFPREGDIVEWLRSVEMLVEFVRRQEADADPTRSGGGGGGGVRISCGHVTAAGPALEILEECLGFMRDVLARKVRVAKEMEVRGYKVVVYEQPGTARFVVLAPVKLIEDARRQLRL
ncbi:Metallo-hydrolase/oxidoreductase [Auricularia subglabra TFB-10046 SS5]|nr:Metallo-hydrolase/oxidoreductase [Auricularia subglabra TFB-10046 SS5]